MCAITIVSVPAAAITTETSDIPSGQKHTGDGDVHVLNVLHFFYHLHTCKTERCFMIHTAGITNKYQC